MALFQARNGAVTCIAPSKLTRDGDLLGAQVLVGTLELTVCSTDACSSAPVCSLRISTGQIMLACPALVKMALEESQRYVGTLGNTCRCLVDAE